LLRGVQCLREKNWAEINNSVELSDSAETAADGKTSRSAA